MMVRVHLAFVPPGGGETDYSRFAELPAVPATGDYLTWASGTGKGTMDFIVRRVWWGVKGDQDGDCVLVPREPEFWAGRVSEWK
jgi:hypothetical protein